jgi:hypothetical protein
MKSLAEPGWKFDWLGRKAWWGGKEYYGIDRQVISDISISAMQDGKNKGIARYWSDKVSELVKKGK